MSTFPLKYIYLCNLSYLGALKNFGKDNILCEVILAYKKAVLNSQSVVLLQPVVIRGTLSPVFSWETFENGWLFLKSSGWLLSMVVQMWQNYLKK